MNREDIIKMAQWAYDHEYGSITLQSGERSDDIFVDYVVDLIREIKAIGDGSPRHYDVRRGAKRRGVPPHA